MNCILTDPNSSRRRIEVAEALGLSLPPIIQEHCTSCNQMHVIETGEAGDQRYGLPPVTIQRTDNKPDKWVKRDYCHTCHAYHNSDGRCGGVREVKDWADKEWR